MALNIEVGEASVSVVADASKFEQQATDQVSRAASKISGAAEKVGRSASDALGSGITSASSGGWVSRLTSTVVNSGKNAALGFANAVADVVRGPATAVVGGASAALGTALVSGFQRLNAIDVAKNKLRGLGHDTQAVESIMKNALASVKGTAFGLGEAATVAAGAVAAGIEPGDKLERTLKIVSNSAAAAGISMEEMGAIFNSAASTGKLSTDVMNQLAWRGIPIWQKLAEQTGTSVEEVRDAVSKGKYTFEDFQTAAEAASGNVAKAMGDTLPGAMKNLLASLGRIGANLQSGIFTKLAPLINALTKSFGPLEDVAKRVGDTIGDKLAPWIDKLTNALNNANSPLDLLKGTFGSLGSVLGPLTGAFITLGSGGIGSLLTKIPGLSGSLGQLSGVFKVLGGPVGLVIGLFGGLVAASPELRAALGDALMGALEGLKAVFTAIEPAIKVFADALKNVGSTAGPAFAKVFEKVGPLLAEFGGKIADVITAAMPSLQSGLSKAGDLFGRLVGAVSQVMPYVIQFGGALISLAGTVISSAVPVISTLAGVIGGFATTVLPKVIPPILQVATAITNGIKGALEWLGPSLKGLTVTILAGIVAWKTYLAITKTIQLATKAWTAVQAAFNVVMNANPVGLVILAITALVAIIVIAWNKSETFRAIVIGGWEAIKLAVSAVADWFTNTLWPGLQAVWDGIVAGLSTLGTFFSDLWNGFLNIVTTVWTAISTFIVTAVTAYVTFWTEVWNGIVTVVTTVWDAIWTTISTVWNTVSTYVLTGIQMVLAGWTAIWNGIVTVLTAVWNGIKAAVSAAINFVVTIIQTQINVIRAVWNAVWNAISSVASAVWGTIKSVVSAGINFVSSIVSSVLNTIKSIWNAAWNWLSSILSSAWNSMRSAVSSGINGVMSFVSSIGGRIKGVFSGAGSWLWNAGLNVIKGFLNGISSMFGQVKSKLKSLTSYLPSWKGPEDTDKKILTPAGRLVIGGFQEAMEKSYPAVKRSLQGFTKDLAPTVDAGLKVNGIADLQRTYQAPVEVNARAGRPSSPSGTFAPTAGPGRFSPTVNITNHYPQARPDSATRDEVAQGIRLAAIV